MPTITPRARSENYESQPLELMGGAVPLEQRVKSALDTVQQLGRYQPHLFPERPYGLAYDDAQLFEAYQQHSYGQIGKSASEQLTLFAQWRNAVWKAEAHNEGNLLAVAMAIHNLETAGDHQETVVRLRGFLREHYRCTLPDPVPGLRSWVERWAVRFAQNRRILPLYMRTMTKPPTGYGARKSGIPEEDQYEDFGADFDTELT